MATAVLLLSGTADVRAQDVSGADASREREAPSGLWEQFLSWLGWGRGTPIITRGDSSREKPSDGYWGDIAAFSLASEDIRQLTREQLLRSPLPDAAGKCLFALSRETLVVHPLAAGCTPRTVDLEMDTGTIKRLLLFREGQIYALRSDNSVVQIDLESGRIETMERDVTPRQVTELMTRVRTCDSHTVGEREYKGRPFRVDLTIRRSQRRETRNLTRTRSIPINADPVFSKDCQTVYFVSSRKPQRHVLIGGNGARRMPIPPEEISTSLEAQLEGIGEIHRKKEYPVARSFLRIASVK